MLWAAEWRYTVLCNYNMAYRTLRAVAGATLTCLPLTFLRVGSSAAEPFDAKKGLIAAENRASQLQNLVIIPGTSHKDLAAKICAHIGIEPAHVDVTQNYDGEVCCMIHSSVNEKDIFVIQPSAFPVNDNIMELLLMISCAKRCGARKVTAVVPYFGYKYHRRGAPISTKHQSRFLWSASADFSKMLHAMGVDRVISVDLQRPGQGHEACFFDNSVPVETVSSNDIMIEYFVNNVPLGDKVAIVAASSEYLKKARLFQQGLTNMPGVQEVTIAAFQHDRDSVNDLHSTLHSSPLLGNVTDKDVIIVDDVVETAGTLSVLCRRLIKEGARKVYLCASHGLFTKNSMELIRLSPVEKVIVTDSLPLPPHVDAKITQVSVAPLLAKVIETEYFANSSTSTKKDDDEKYKIM